MMKKYSILFLSIVLSCSVKESPYINNNDVESETVWDSIKMPIYTFDETLIPVFNQVIRDELTCKYSKERDDVFVLMVKEEKDSCDIYVELIEKNSIKKNKNAGCFIYNNELFVVNTFSKHIRLFQLSSDSILFKVKKNPEPEFILIDDRGSFWNYRLIKDSLLLVHKSICNY